MCFTAAFDYSILWLVYTDMGSSGYVNVGEEQVNTNMNMNMTENMICSHHYIQDAVWESSSLHINCPCIPQLRN
jgi:hypothetical protein